MHLQTKWWLVLFPHFFFTSLSNLSDFPLIIWDFNTVINPSIDRSNNSKQHTNCQTTETIKQFMSDFGLGDCWWLKHPTASQYLFFSPVHHFHIDFFLTSNSIISQTSDTLILVTMLPSPSHGIWTSLANHLLGLHHVTETKRGLLVILKA